MGNFDGIVGVLEERGVPKGARTDFSVTPDKIGFGSIENVVMGSKFEVSAVDNNPLGMPVLPTNGNSLKR